MNVLGISCYYHDAAAALLADGQLIAAAEEERFSRKKHDNSFPERAIGFCLERAGLRADDLDYVVFYEKPIPKFERILVSALQTVPRSITTFRESMISWITDKLWIKSKLVSRFGISRDRILFVDHHLSHAASAFFCSPFDDAAVLTVDGVGEWTTTAIGYGKAAFDGGPCSLTLDQELRFPHSLGLLYSAFTAFLGFEVNEGEYKVMGMAPYGVPRFVDDVYKLVDARKDGSFELNMDYFSFHHSTTATFNRRFTDLFGPARPPEAEFRTQLTHPECDADESIVRSSQRYADIAASIQRAAEQMLLALARQAFERTSARRLCLAGGVALNSVANGRILREGPFDELYVQPAAGDSGGALGAALYAYHVLLGQPRSFVMKHASWGQDFDQDDIVDAVRRAGASFEVVDDEERLLDRVADDLVGGKVVGWFQGRFEWGPRALGHRSILADPRRAAMKQIVNEKIKFREPFRPFAPAVPVEHAARYFDLADPRGNYPARFMLVVVPICSEHQSRLAAVNHLGTARVQTVHQDDNPRYHRLINQFGQATGVPVLLNTSFNVRGEPIVTTPGEALSTFRRSGMETLVLGSVVVNSAS
jgi:carbamoyltransferase